MGRDEFRLLLSPFCLRWANEDIEILLSSFCCCRLLLAESRAVAVLLTVLLLVVVAGAAMAGADASSSLNLDPPSTFNRHEGRRSAIVAVVVVE